MKTFIIIILLLSTICSCTKTEVIPEKPVITAKPINILGKWQDGYSYIWGKKGTVSTFYYNFKSDSTFTCNKSIFFPDLTETSGWFVNEKGNIHLFTNYPVHTNGQAQVFMDSIAITTGKKSSYYDTILPNDQIHMYGIPDGYYPRLHVDLGEWIRVQ